MTQAVEKLKVELAALSVEDREELAYYLMGTLGEEGDADEQAAFDAELARRGEEIKTGKVKGIPADEVFARLRAKYP